MKKFFFLLIIMGFLIIYLLPKKSFYDVLKCADGVVDVNELYIYGNHLNISGNISLDNYDNIYLVFKNADSELSYDVFYQNGIFTTSSLINEGIYLDNIKNDKYFLFLKVVSSDNTTYYSLNNNTIYKDTDYYTITNHDDNNLINIRSGFKDKSYIMVESSKTNDECYDIVIDAGHGGDDPGASYAKHDEAKITLDYALGLKKALEDIGLKVKLTRDKDISLLSYGPFSRTGIVYESHAKYAFSIHLNSTTESIHSGGVEVYSPSSANLDFASSLASNIVNSADTNYSHNEAFNVRKGVYVRTFTKSDISSSVETANKNGFKPYMINNQTDYYFMIRETGGIATNAYVDGRDKRYNKNDYFNSNVGCESYLLELGYINYWGDLNNLIDNKNGYINGIVSAIKDELNI